MRSVAVVGAGLAGLAAAAELKSAGWHVELFERSRLLGGRATSFEVDGHVVDNGQHVFLACCTEFVRFVQRTGTQSALYLQDRFDVVAYARNGASSRLRALDLPPPLHLLASFARYRHLSIPGKLQVARALLTLRLNPKSARDDQSFAAWLESQRQGAQAIRSFWQPFMVAALNAPLDRMNAADAAFVISTAFLRGRGDARIGYATVPLAQIMENAAAKLDAVYRSCAVTAVDLDARGVAVRDLENVRKFDAAVLAVPPRALEKLVGDLRQTGLPPLDVYEPFAIMDVHLWHDAGALDFDFAALLDSPVQWIFQKAPGYLCCSMSAADASIAKPTSEMVALAWQEVRGILPRLAAARLIRGAATRNPEGTYLPKPGASRPQGRCALPNLAIAGAWTGTGWPDTMESAVRSGLRAARILQAGTPHAASQGEEDLPTPVSATESSRAAS